MRESERESFQEDSFEFIKFQKTSIKISSRILKFFSKKRIAHVKILVSESE